MAKPVSVADAKRDFSELMGRVALRMERFIITRNGKAMAALVNMKDIERLETLPQEQSKKGLLAAVGAWKSYTRHEQFVNDLYVARRKAKDRRVEDLR